MNALQSEHQSPDGFTTLLPTYAEAASLIGALNGVPRNDVRALVSTLMSLTGTPQQTLDWLNPEEWVPARLQGDQASLAVKIWHGTNGLVNPRHMRGHLYFIQRHTLLDVDNSGTFRMSDRSKRFINQDKELLLDIDRIEGLSFLIQQIASLGTTRVGDTRAEWASYVSSRSKYSAETSIKSLLRHRLINLESRGLITRHQGRISITEQGIDYARINDNFGKPEADERGDLMKSIREYNQLQRDHLTQQLAEMDPYAFEYLVRDLLEEMGYSEVSVTSQGGDFGVDVVATVEFGITTITEYVQVKRRTQTLGRKEVDQLRGALPYHGALRGTLITLGSFSSGCESAAIFPGAQPITLIDGEKLVDLLLNHEVAMKRRPVELHEVDESYFALAKDSPAEDEQEI